MMKTATKQLDCKCRILNKAMELFYNQGYYQTGINQIIAESDVSKATFYSHYPSKEDLALAYIQKQHTDAMAMIKEAINQHKQPKEKLLSFVNGLVDWMIASKFRGCEFLNITSEIIDPKHPIRKEVKYHMDAVRSILKDLFQDLVRSDPKYRHLDPEEMADKYFIIFNGGIASTTEYYDIWPMKLAAKMIEELIH